MAERQIRIGIVDDHPVFRVGLVRSLERAVDLSILWELGSVSELTSMLETCPVDVVLMDLNLGPDQDALGATTVIRQRHDSVKVIVISASLDWEGAAAARAAGASGYLPKDLAVRDMVAAIRGLASPTFGHPAFNDMLNSRPGSGGQRLSLRRGLTRREQEVLAELRRGRTNKEIATRLNVSVSTVNKHVQQILKKLDVRSRTQAVAKIHAEASGRSYPAGERRR
ncbi:MAG: response regulator transcription factor [Candidatus Dormibacterales bacterium]